MTDRTKILILVLALILAAISWFVFPPFVKYSIFAMLLIGIPIIENKKT